jgi:hypothetical protein
MLKRGAIAFEVAGRAFSILVLGYAILFGGSSPLLFLWGLWIEEVLSLIGLSVRKAVAHRGGGAERSASPLALSFAFPAVHLVFVLFFSLAGATGMFSPPGISLLASPRPADIAKLAAAFAFWILVDLGRAILLGRGGGPVEGELAGIDREARLALFLPHITIIAGGFCLIMLKLGNWLAWGILAGKVIFELLSFAMSRDAQRRPPPRGC